MGAGISFTKFSIDQYYSSGYVYYLKDVESIEEKMKTLETYDHEEILKKKVTDSNDLRKLLLFEQLRMFPQVLKISSHFIASYGY